jgi:hypothetical protein
MNTTSSTRTTPDAPSSPTASSDQCGRPAPRTEPRTHLGPSTSGNMQTGSTRMHSGSPGVLRPGSGLDRPMILPTEATSPTPITSRHRRSGHDELGWRIAHFQNTPAGVRRSTRRSRGALTAELERASPDLRRGCPSCFTSRSRCATEGPAAASDEIRTCRSGAPRPPISTAFWRAVRGGATGTNGAVARSCRGSVRRRG